MQLPNILIIDYNLGNIFSVQNACKYNGTNTTYFTQGNNTGAGNSALTPSWATGWTTGL